MPIHKLKDILYQYLRRIIAVEPGKTYTISGTGILELARGHPSTPISAIKAPIDSGIIDTYADPEPLMSNIQ
jgi:hypothetical protein